MPERIAILGAGSWGTALAVHCARIGHDVRLWARSPTVAHEMAVTRRNPGYLPDVCIDERVAVTASLPAATDGAGIVVVAVPSHGLRAVVRAAAPALAPVRAVVSATKGLEVGTLARMSSVIQEETGGGLPVVALSGPSFAAEVAARLPTAIVAACGDHQAATMVQEAFRGPTFRLYATEDVAGVEFGGALKNVIAIAAGVVEGLSLGHNALAGVITRGLAEMSRLACAEGGRRETLAGLSGLGDLVLTCTGSLSRNRGLGIELGHGRALDDILSGMRMVAEGVRTTQAAVKLGERHGVELPITTQMAAVLEGRVAPAEAVETLMGRRQRHEQEN
ncbi:MAG TPA: NAD(P)H-dependent glycerol-3-phosphate dehydrogenase [Vicinamibacterales bacterium]|nr:NAD(P)H-dependent glycerol-3-phosphate dehydrogenase [Vicinamibacterales bacterium]